MLEIKGISQQIEDIRIIINGKEFKLTAVQSQNQEILLNTTQTLVTFVSQLIEELRNNGRIRTAETYRCALNSFLRFLEKDDILFCKINKALIYQYEQNLKAKGIIKNSSSFYMRVLRTIYNRAVDSGLTTDQHPFTLVYTGIGKTVKRAITLMEIKQIQQLDNLTENEKLARDLFLFSLYTRGMSFIDMSYLQPNNIQNGVLTYQRHKTGQQLCIKWERQMQDIVNRHPSSNNKYLLPIIKRNNGCERSQYRGCQRLVNCLLKNIGKKAKIVQPLTMYVARHSWASIAHEMDVPVSVISEAMGHTSEHTTQIYLKSLDHTRLDNTNASIIQAVIPINK